MDVHAQHMNIRVTLDRPDLYPWLRDLLETRPVGAWAIVVPAVAFALVLAERHLTSSKAEWAQIGFSVAASLALFTVVEQGVLFL